MAEFLIRVVDKRTPTGYWQHGPTGWEHVDENRDADDMFIDHATTHKRGDVIHAAPDGWPWGSDELISPFWRIIKVPGLELLEAQAMVAREIAEDPTNPPRTLQRRAFRLDIDHPSLPAAFREYLQDDTRASAAYTLSINRAAFRVLKKARLPIPDPAVIGGPTNVIG